MTGAERHPVVLFDGVCNFCDASVKWIIARDTGGVFRFAPLQSPAGVALQRCHGLDPGAFDALTLLDDGRVHRRSSAALRILRRLPWPWPALFLFVAVPPFIRDSVYSLLARHRYRWFGPRAECTVPAPGVRDRFLLE